MKIIFSVSYLILVTLCLRTEGVEHLRPSQLKGLPAIKDIRSEAFPYELNLVCSSFNVKYIIYDVKPVIKGSRSSIKIRLGAKFSTILKHLLKESNMSYLFLDGTLVVYDKAVNQNLILNILEAKFKILRKSPKFGVVAAFEKKDGKYFDLPECPDAFKLINTAKPKETLINAMKNYLSLHPQIQGCEFDNNTFSFLRKEKFLNLKEVVNAISDFANVEYTLKGPSYSPVIDFWLPYFLEFHPVEFARAMGSDDQWMDTEKGTAKPIREIIWNKLFDSKNKIIMNFLVNSFLKCKDTYFLLSLLEKGKMPTIDKKIYRLKEIQEKCVKSGNKRLKAHFINSPANISRKNNWPIKPWRGFDGKGSDSPPKKLLFKGDVGFPYFYYRTKPATTCGYEKLNKKISLYKYVPSFSISSMIPNKSFNVSSTPELAALSLFSSSKCEAAWNALQNIESSEYFVLLYRLDFIADNMKTVAMIGYAPINNNEFYSIILYRQQGKWLELVEFSQEGEHREASIISDSLDICVQRNKKSKISKSLIIRKINEKIFQIIHNKLTQFNLETERQP